MTNSMQAILDKAAKRPDKPAKAAKGRQPRAKQADSAQRAQRAPRPVREGQRFIGGHFDPPVLQQLKIIAAEDDTTVQDLLAEALDLLFVKRGKDTIEKLRR